MNKVNVETEEIKEITDDLELEELTLPELNEFSAAWQYRCNELKKLRDNSNSKVKCHLTERNQINKQVKDLIGQVAILKNRRDKANEIVKELKIGRKTLDTELKSQNKIKKDKIEFNSEEEKSFNQSKKDQEAAHRNVVNAVDEAQIAHDVMIEISEEVDKLRLSANHEHEQLILNKKIGDVHHHKYMAAVNRIKIIKGCISRIIEENNIDFTKDQMGIINTIENIKLKKIVCNYYLETDPDLSQFNFDKLLIFADSKLTKSNQVRIVIFSLKNDLNTALIGNRGETIHSVKSKLANSYKPKLDYFVLSLECWDDINQYYSGDLTKYLSSKKLPLIRDFATQLGLVKSGKKSEIIVRILNHIIEK